MNAKIKELHDQKQSTWSKMQDVARALKEGKTLNNDEEKQFDGWDNELKSLTANIARLERADALEAELSVAQLKAEKGNGEKSEPEAPVSAFERKSIFTRAMYRGAETLSAEEKNIYASMKRENAAFVKLVSGGELSKEESQIMQRAQSTTVAAGGYTIPQGFLAKIDAKLKYISPFFAEMNVGLNPESESIFEVLRTSTGNDLPFPTNDDTATVGELLAENTDAFANAADLTFGQVTMKAYKYSSKPMKVSNELLNDSGVDLESYIANALATRIARIANTHFTTGDNSSKPQGIVGGATAGKTSAASAAITFPEIIDLEHSVDASYRNSPSCRFMLHDLILAYLKKQTIGSSTNDSRPLWQPGYTAGAPDTIDGFRYLINNDMASTLVTTNISMLFGDMKKYYVRVINEMSIKRLTERFADSDQTAWLLFARLDGRYANTSAIKKLTQV